ncbi:hypothetical protein PV328_004458 [Microctonus aethiopoides]|nr:hypothetical protein PV328_004458 [Microctonus aethiopoides]
MSSIIIQGGGLEAMVISMEDFDPGVKESAAWAIGYVARHNSVLAQTVVNAGVVPLLIMAMQESELYLKQISASALCDISKHSSDLAQTVTDAGAIPFLARSIINSDAKLKRQVFLALGSIAKHSVNLAESVVEADIFPSVLIHMGHPDENVQKAAAVLTRDICKHTLELAQLVANTGGIAALIELICTTRTTTKPPAIMALGYIAGHSAQLAMIAIESKGASQLASVLEQETDDDILAITAWALGQMGKHSPDHAKAIATTNIFPRILQLYSSSNNSENLKDKIKTALKNILLQCTDIEAIEPLIQNAPTEILKYVLGQFSKILPNDPRARRLFVTTGGLKKVQELQPDATSPLSEYIAIINSCFPEEIIRYYTPGYSDSLLESLEQYQPKRLSSIKIGAQATSETSNSSRSLNYINERRN